MQQSASTITSIKAGEGQQYNVAGGQYRILVSRADTDGSYAVIEMNVPPGGGPLPHAHPEIEETFYVAEGEIVFNTDNGPVSVSAGSFVRIPLNGGVHAFKNTSGKPARLLCTVMPAGLDEMFKEVSTATPEQIPAIITKYNQQLYPADYFDSKAG
ncbi:cupin domain-containing protein [Mucilaginibacter sp. JRF]|uniref:cupin domain-containing protein n=1 Tax=Mucilaginibacter sp. JRF TaxID=2780088 RepID=UPI0018812528|nr:cupin domain-containing protein [Mucilaginibacter sp. JRF]MBE9583094.1 cupin domain-containing protein [Mucilaginibacter sp. JRF]